MEQFTIRQRASGAVLFEGRFDTMRLCVEAAVKQRANLFGASLDGANLARANLFGARLAGANLAGAILAGAILAGAILAGANLARANLAGADLARANLADADLAHADLAHADLTGANLAGANLRDNCVATGAPVRRATRSDGYEFFLWPTNHGWRVGAGCRWFTFEGAWAHWSRPRAGGDPCGLNPESLDILTMFRLAMDRAEEKGWRD